jgi:hypothetical protein
VESGHPLTGFRHLFPDLPWTIDHGEERRKVAFLVSSAMADQMTMERTHMTPAPRPPKGIIQLFVDGHPV